VSGNNLGDPPILRRIARRVRERRQNMGLTARQLAERAGLSARFVSDLENGRANIAIGRLNAVADVLGVDVGELVASTTWLASTSAAIIGAVDGPRVRNMRDRPVALLGMRGAGKSTLGRLLADALVWEFVEVDARIEEVAGLDLASIFSMHGEDYYRLLEALVVGTLLGEPTPRVLALSGGLVTNKPAFELVRRRCTTVWLHARPEQHMERVLGQGDDRPLADRSRPLEELKIILRAREPSYRLANLAVDTSDGDPAAVLEELLAALDVQREERKQLV